jgi:hypothetical protein
MLPGTTEIAALSLSMPNSSVSVARPASANASGSSALMTETADAAR